MHMYFELLTNFSSQHFVNAHQLSCLRKKRFAIKAFMYTFYCDILNF